MSILTTFKNSLTLGTIHHMCNNVSQWVIKALAQLPISNLTFCVKQVVYILYFIFTCIQILSRHYVYHYEDAVHITGCVEEGAPPTPHSPLPKKNPIPNNSGAVCLSFTFKKSQGPKKLDVFFYLQKPFLNMKERTTGKKKMHN